jgi:probable F420-dependent oxidoreductase
MGIRFLLHRARAGSAEEWREHAVGAEAAGYAGIMVSDHLGGLDPMVALGAAAGATERITLGTNVLNNDFWHPVMLARATATLDVVSNGRTLLGMGAGWNRPEYDHAGIRFDGAPARIRRMAEAARILKALFAGETVSHESDDYRVSGLALDPLPPQGADLPIMVGGNGDLLLRTAAEVADVVGLTGFSASSNGMNVSHFSRDGFADRLAYVQEHAGDRVLDVNVLVQRFEVTDDAGARFAELAADYADGGPEAPDESDLIGSPFMLIGTEDEIVAKVARIRADFGVDSYSVFGARSSERDSVVARMLEF